jgi:pectate lyase
MIRKAFTAAALLALASSAYAATDYPSGYTKCAKDGETCTFSGTRSVAYGKAGTFVYATLTGPISCAASRFPAINVGTPRYCSYGAVTTPPTCPATTIGPVINGAQSASATVTSGASVAFAPTPTSGGSWSWSGCGTSGTSRTQTVSPTASCTATASYTNSCGTVSTQVHTITVNSTPSCPATTITAVINGTQTASATINSGAAVAFAPLPASGGSWSWSGCGTSGSSRTQTVSPTASCTATATHTNSCGTQSTRAHTITVNGTTPPSTPSGTPIGFGRSTTGGAGGATVTASTGTQINQALCGRASVSTPIIIRVTGTINHGNTTKVSGSCDTTATEVELKGVSNITIVGVGTSGVLDQIGLHIRNSSNIIIRNLHIKNVKKSGSPTSNGGDSIGMETSVNNIWIDHNTLEASGGESDGYDSLLDMKAGVTNVTVSYNHYRNSSRAGLIGSSDSDSANTNITFHHNWYENIEQRTPLLRHGLAHSYNNYFSNLSNSDMIHGINSRMGGRILVEGNYFKNSNNPLLASDDSSSPGCWQTRANFLDSISYDRSVGDGALVVPIISGGQFDSTCTVSVPYSYTLDSASGLPSSLPGQVGVGKIQ